MPTTQFPSDYNPADWQLSNTGHRVAYLSDSGWSGSSSTPSSSGVYELAQTPNGLCNNGSGSTGGDYGEEDLYLSTLPNLLLDRAPTSSTTPSYTFTPASSSQGSGSFATGSRFDTSRPLYDSVNDPSVVGIRHLYLSLTAQLIHQVTVAKSGCATGIGYLVTINLVNYKNQQTLYAGFVLGNSQANYNAANWYSTSSSVYGFGQNVVGLNTSPLSCGTPPAAFTTSADVTSPNSPITYNLDLYCPIATLIANAPTGSGQPASGMDTAPGDWYVHGVYFGHSLYGGVTATSRWGNFSLSASTAS